MAGVKFYPPPPEYQRIFADPEIQRWLAGSFPEKHFNSTGLIVKPMADKIERIVDGIAGTIEVEGEKIHYTFRSIGKGQSVIESYYDAPISIADNGFGLEYAIRWLRTEVLAQKAKRKNK